MINWQASVGRAAKVCLTTQTSFTTTGSPLTTESCGAVTTPSTTGVDGCRQNSKADRSHGRSSAPTSSKRSRNSRTCSSATCGAEPSTPQAVSPSSGARDGRACWLRTWLYRPRCRRSTLRSRHHARSAVWASLTCRTNILGKEKPWPFPPEPFRFMGIQATRWSLEREDKTGRRNLWLKALDKVGLGFDS